MHVPSDPSTYVEAIKTTDMSRAYEAINILQKTQWRINAKVLAVIQYIWEKGHGYGDLPCSTPISTIQYPFGDTPRQDLTEEQVKVYKEWAARNATIHEHNAKLFSRTLQFNGTLNIAEEYVGYERFYFPWSVDFRGRAYPNSVFLSPQAVEWSKALLEFARPAVCRNMDDVKWLAIHGANVFGFDKAELDERVEWAFNFTDAIKVAEDPIENHSLWDEADKPYLFLAWCFEWAQFLTETYPTRQDDGSFGVPFDTHLPCAADGTANGLQHLSAIIRDETGAVAVNLTKTKKPSDVYAIVAKDVKAKLKILATSGSEDERTWAEKWLEYGIDRKITKRSVMVVPYNGTKQACFKYIRAEYIEATNKGRKPNVFEDVYKPAYMLTNLVWDSIGAVIKSSRIVMTYIKEIAKIYSAFNQHLEWVTPDGMLVRPHYYSTKERRIETKVCGSVIRLRAPKSDMKYIDKAKMKTSSAPNFIHSLDATAMRMAITVANKVDGIEDFAVVHDSFATHSPNMPALGAALRETFVEMYIDNDVLTQLREHCITTLAPFGLKDEDVPPVPPRGSFDIHRVLESPYMFS